MLSPKRRMGLKKHYLRVGLAAASLVAAGVLGLGAMSNGGGAEAPGAGSSPSASPGLSGDGVASSPIPRPSATRTDTSLAKLEAAHRDSPLDPALLLKLGEAYYLSQRYMQAGAAYRDALALNPGDTIATVRLAMVWHALGGSDRAARAIEDVLSREPRHQEAHYSLAVIRFSQQKLEDARTEWAAAARIDPLSVLGHRSQSFVDLLNDGQLPAGEDAAD